MDIDNYLKNHLNKEGHIKNKNLEELISVVELTSSSEITLL